MEKKLFHYDGSLLLEYISSSDILNEGFQITDEVRKIIACNPYAIQTEE
ncbi:hypothetical protein ACE38V_11070 [Cytobacillus sp. Hz8]